MIECKIEQRSNGLLRIRMEGHAGDANGRNDIVCAACSSLAYTLGQCVMIMYAEGQMQNKPKAEVSKGHALIQAFPKNESYNEALHCFWMFTVGMAMIAKNYPQYVKVENDISTIES